MDDKVDNPLDIVDSVDYHINDISWHQVSGIKNEENFMNWCFLGLDKEGINCRKLENWITNGKNAGL